MRKTQRFCSKACSDKNERGENGNNWKGNNAGYDARHHRVYAVRGPARECVWGCESPRYEWAHYLGEVGPTDEYAGMCARCHRRFDGAIAMMSKPVVSGHRRWRPERQAA